MAVSRTAHYRYLQGDSYQLSPEKTEYQQLVEQTFNKHKRRYGSQRFKVELQEKGQALGRHQVRTLMKKVGLQAVQPKSFLPRTTDSTHGRGYWPDQPLPKAPNLAWVSRYYISASGHWRLGLLSHLDGSILA